MTRYAIYFHQEWVGDHPAEWFAERGPLAKQVVADMADAGVLVFAGGLDEDLSHAVTADATSGELRFTEGPYAGTQGYLGGITIIDVATAEEARVWGGRIAEACGWPQEVRAFG